MKRLLLYIICAIASVSAQAIAIKDIPNVHLADSTRLTSDPSGALSSSALAKTDSVLTSIMRQTSAEPAM
ncbi:MAG: TPM domain-containing protein, partial [Muribaculaceae bacterium]|nr:TPM domain-containing protein [Muribaculaceae bacterium]